MDNTIISALISATVSIIVALIAYGQARREWRKERELLERQLQRNLTEKLYELRLANYPKAFELTESLRSEILFSGQLKTKEMLIVRNNLIDWARQYGFFMSKKSIQAYYALRQALKVKGEGEVSKSDTKKIFEAKNRFRGNLRHDVNLLYVEEQESKDEE